MGKLITKSITFSEHVKVVSEAVSGNTTTYTLVPVPPLKSNEEVMNRLAGRSGEITIVIQFKERLMTGSHFTLIGKSGLTLGKGVCPYPDRIVFDKIPLERFYNLVLVRKNELGMTWSSKLTSPPKK